MSCGVDAFNNVLKYKDFPIEKFRITHCLFLNHGAMGVSEYKKSKEIFEKEKVHVTNACKALGLKVICMNTNMMELYGKIYTHRANNNEGLKTAATVYVLRKLFARFMIASTVGIDMFKFSDGDVGYFAPFTTDVMSSDVKFYIGDLDTARRIDKVKNIADNPIVQKYLHVNPVKNCGRCTYCVETMAELWAIGKLDNFKESFPINDFKKNFRRRMANYLTDDHEAEFGFPKETLVTAKENGLHLPIGTRFLSWIYYRPKHFVGKLLRMKKLR